MIDRVFARLVAGIERVLALAFVAAVCLNFINVIGRYVIGSSILGADEVQIFIMVYMTFLGAVAITWRKEHLRMDVLVQFFPGWVRASLHAAELALVLVLAGFVLSQSVYYVSRMFTLQEKSNTAGIPMWIPHSAVALGFGLITLIALWRAVEYARRGAAPAGASAAQEGAKP